MHLHFDYGSGNTLGTRGKVSCVQHQQLAKKHTHIHVRTYSLNTKVYAMSEHLRGVLIRSHLHGVLAQTSVACFAQPMTQPATHGWWHEQKR